MQITIWKEFYKKRQIKLKKIYIIFNNGGGSIKHL